MTVTTDTPAGREDLIDCCFIPISPVTNRTPPQLLITKVKQFAGSAPFVTRSQWGVDQLRQVNGIDPNKVRRKEA